MLIPSQMDNKSYAQAVLKGSFMTFTKTFFQLRTGREFLLSNPSGRESHYVTMAKEFKNVFMGKTKRLMINIPPRYGKSEACLNFIAYALANYPDSNFIYTSYAQSLASMQTQTVRDIISLPYYKAVFDVGLDPDTGAKDDFKTTGGGRVFAAGAGGPITGRGAGLKGVDRFGGCIIIDDAHKPEEVHSDTLRARINEWFYNTLQSRLNDPETPIIAIGQMLHEDDLLANLRKIKGKDGNQEWRVVSLPALDILNNPLYPEMHNLEALLKMKRDSPYVFASQYQQDPQPAGGGIFKPEWFQLLDYEPKIISTFITADTAETDKDYNDATVFSFWGIYRIEFRGIDSGLYGLHWLNCRELRCEPKDLENEFYDFYAGCMRHKVKPTVAAIEKKSTGVTLCSILQSTPGLRIMDIQRTRAGGSKTTRFLECQPFVSAKRITFTKDARHAEMCIEHCRKITANNTHAHDDVCFITDTLIATKLGNKFIQDIVPGDLVITPFGYGKVLDSKMTSPLANVMSSHGLVGTRNHPIFSGHEFKPLDTLRTADKISSLSFKELFEWRYKKVLLSMASHTDSWDRDAIISASQIQMKGERVRKDFMLRSGNFIAERRFKKALLFITKMAITLTTTLAILSVYRISNTWNSIANKNQHTRRPIKTREILQKLSRKQKNGIEARKGSSGISKTLKQAYTNLSHMFAKFVKNPTSAKPLQEAFAAGYHAEESCTEKQDRLSISFAEFAQNHLKQKKTSTREGSRIAAQGRACPNLGTQPVYNLRVDLGVYYANGVLVSNCDTMQTAIQVALIEGTLLPRETGESDEVMRALSDQMSLISNLRQRI